MKIILRLANKDDVPNLINIVREFYSDSKLYDSINFSAEDCTNFLTTLLELPNSNIILASSGDVIIGLASFMVVPCFVDKSTTIFQGINLYVLPKYRGYGIGRRLYSKSEELAKEMGCTIFTVETPVNATEIQNLHKSNGYSHFQNQFYKVVN